MPLGWSDELVPYLRHNFVDVLSGSDSMCNLVSDTKIDLLIYVTCFLVGTYYESFYVL